MKRALTTFAMFAMTLAGATAFASGTEPDDTVEMDPIVVDMTPFEVIEMPPMYITANESEPAATDEVPFMLITFEPMVIVARSSAQPAAPATGKPKLPTTRLFDVTVAPKHVLLPLPTATAQVAKR